MVVDLVSLPLVQGQLGLAEAAKLVVELLLRDSPPICLVQQLSMLEEEGFDRNHFLHEGKIKGLLRGLEL